MKITVEFDNGDHKDVEVPTSKARVLQDLAGENLSKVKLSKAAAALKVSVTALKKALGLDKPEDDTPKKEKDDK